MKILKNKKGLTLIELIVGIVMFTIIALTVATSLTPTLFAFMSANDFAEYNALLDNIANQIVGDMMQATEPSPGSDNPVFPDNVWIVDDSEELIIRIPGRVVRYSIGKADNSFICV